MTGVYKRRGKEIGYRNKEESQATMKSGIGTMQLKAKESEDFQEPPEAGRGNEGLFQRLQREHGPADPGSWPLELCENIFLLSSTP